MALTLYHSIDKEKKPLENKKGVIKIYSCGPTVYDSPHIGNLRSMISTDLLNRALNFLNYKTETVINITDIDDKTIKGSQEKKQSLKEFTQIYTDKFFSDLAKLNIKLPEHTPKATDFIPQMIEMIETLIEKDFAYKTTDGIYFSIDKFPDYGHLIGVQKKDQDKNISRLKIDNYDKEKIADFALWKFYTPKDGQVKWEAPFGAGRPGWHIECSAMAINILGPTIDIHTGGSDLMFPHHSNEIAQSESYTGQTFVRHWLHFGMIKINNEKMSKSLNNFLVLDDLLKDNIPPLAFRYLTLGTHYRSLLNFTDQAIKNAHQALNNLAKNLFDLKQQTSTTGTVNEEAAEAFKQTLENDLNLPQALSVVWQTLNNNSIQASDRLITIYYFDKVLGLNLEAIINKANQPPSEITKLHLDRLTARQQKDWPLADKLRAEIEEANWTIRDISSNNSYLLPIDFYQQ
ncbi:MAG: cysteine--tRNA ligase [Patescibacteria group bacterium]